MNISVLGLAALRAAELESHAKKIHVSRKLITDFEREPNEASHLVCRELRRVLKLVSNDKSASKEDQSEAKRLSYRIRSFDPRRTAKESEGRDDSDLLAACSPSNDIDIGVSSTSDDIWDSPPPLPTEEGFRLVNLQQPFQVFVCGEFLLKPGSSSKLMIEAAIDGRPFTAPTLLKLYEHMKQSFSSGGIALASGPLFSELERILKSKGALPNTDPNQKTYAEKFVDELEGRG